jgi:enoyl-CoA hydratase/carnithine racemase
MTDPSLPTVSIAGAVATLRFNRPAQRNSLRDADLRALLDSLARLDADASVRVVVLSASTQGQPRPVFCAGYDVAGFGDGDQGPRLFEQVADAVESLRPITVCALNGSVYGGATDLVLACDLRVGLAGSEWRMPAAAIGLHYAPGGLRRYVSRLGLNEAKRAFLTAQAVPIERLQQQGLFDQVVDAAAFDGALQTLVAQVAALAPLAAQATKRSLNEIACGDFNRAQLLEREATTLRSADFAEGRAALAEKRTPTFRGV